MKKFAALTVPALLGFALTMLIWVGCERSSYPGESNPRIEEPSPTPKVQEVPPTPTATPELVPAVKHVAAKVQPIPDLATIVKGEGQRLPSVQRTQWETAKIKPVFQISVDKAVMLYLRTKDRYAVVEKMRSNGVPAPVLFTLHYRESSNSFLCHPHEGSSLLHRTRYVPKGRLPSPKEPPYKWEVSAEDAYYVADRLQGNWTDLLWAFNAMERFNGMGYKKRGVLSPYLWSGTDKYVSGKYVSDGRYSASAVDKQLGTIAILLRMRERGIPIVFD